ncbi:hypothetical protein Hanom_Chr07g00639981 [Helianthus anomalus]
MIFKSCLIVFNRYLSTRLTQLLNTNTTRLTTLYLMSLTQLYVLCTKKKK